MPDLSKWIQKFVQVFKKEIGTSFEKTLKYLKDLNQASLTNY